jgi:uncharacterized membrane protein YhiD involved in acid resistance
LLLFARDITRNGHELFPLAGSRIPQPVTFLRRTPTLVRCLCACALALDLAGLGAPVLRAMQPPPAAAEPAPASPFSDLGSLVAPSEFEMLFIRLPLAAVLGTALAFRPRRRSQGARKVVVIQTQIMLAVVGAVIMLVVGNSLSRAFGIVGAAGLIRYRSNIADPKDAVVMLSSLAAGLAAGVGLYRFAGGATVFMMLLLWFVEFFEPPARKFFELRINTSTVGEFRAKAEDVLKAMGFEFELLLEDEDEIRYSVSAPVDVRTKDVSDTLRLVGGNDVIVKWEQKKPSR